MFKYIFTENYKVFVISCPYVLAPQPITHIRYCLRLDRNATTFIPRNSSEIFDGMAIGIEEIGIEIGIDGMGIGTARTSLLLEDSGLSYIALYLECYFRLLSMSPQVVPGSLDFLEWTIFPAQLLRHVMCSPPLGDAGLSIAHCLLAMFPPVLTRVLDFLDWMIFPVQLCIVMCLSPLEDSDLSPGLRRL